MKPIASAILDRLLSGKDLSWVQLSQTLLSLLDQRHILVQLDDPMLTDLLAKRRWDGALHRMNGDFLMAVDTNVGYSKTNAVVNMTMHYDVDLTDPAAPESSLVVAHKNNAVDVTEGSCAIFPQYVVTDVEYWYPINRCYFNYLRVYVPYGTSLLESSTHGVTRNDMVWLDQDVPPRVDVLSEKIDGIQGFGTLMMIPMQQSLATSFHFQLPGDVVQPLANSRNLTYKLYIQKQAGVISMPATVRIHLPNGARVQSFSPSEGILSADDLLFNLELTEDAELEIVFQP
jgi:hypothetical protein